ncbi:MAG: amino acid adenylation domain-containing protein [Acidobacteriota bacterium]|nr:amino acid adenylation domain-containing protein [Acidobacteriota bacterium]
MPDTKALMAKAVVELRDARARARKLEDAAHAPVAIIGMSCRFPGQVDSADAFRELLWNGTDAISPVPADRWNAAAYTDADPDAAGKIVSAFGGFIDEVGRFDAEFFGISPREAENMDPQHRLLLETTWRALEYANLPPSQLRGSETGVFAGICTYDYAIRHLVANHAPVTAHFGTGNALSAAAGRLSYLFGFTGPALSIDTACSSSLVSVHLASQALRHGECTTAIAAGVNLMLTPHTNMSFSRARMLAADGRCKPFDAAANGYVRGEGCGVVVLKLLADAQRDGDPVLAVIRGSAVNQDGASSGLTVPNGPAQQDVIRKALANARTRPQDVTYVEAHGTGTSLGDPIEARSLSASYCATGDRQAPLWIGSVKSNIGHLEGAAGIASLIKTVLVLQHGAIPPSLHFSSPNPAIDWQASQLQVPQELTPWPPGAPRAAAVSSFGFTGTNAHVIVEAAPPLPTPPPASAGYVVLPLSARDPEALARVTRDYVALFEGLCAGSGGGNPSGLPATLADVAAVAALGRDHFAHRRAVVAATPAEAAELLRSGQQARHAADASHVALATRYEASDTIDWETVADGSARARAHAPGYPFAGARHWLDEGAGLLPDYLADHQVFGRALVPAAALVELVLNAGREALGSERLLVEDFAIHRPLAWTHDLSRSVRVETSPAGQHVRVVVKAGSDTIAEGDVSEGAASQTGNPKKGLPPPSGDAVDVESIYAACADRGLNYGPAFRTLARVDRGETTVRAEVTLPAAVSLAGSMLHPALLDGCFQATAVLYPPLLPSSLYLPVRIRRLAVYRDAGSSAHCEAQLVDASADGARVDLRLDDAHGQAIASIEGLELAIGSASTIEARLRVDERPRELALATGASLDAVRRIAGAILRLPPDSVDPDVPLTAMGLDSLMAIELRSACSEAFQVDVPVADLIRDLTVAGIVQRIDRQAGSPVPAPVVADEPAELPLSHGQSALWYLHQLQPESPAYNIAFAVRVRSAVDEAALRARVGALVERHAQLRRVYRETEAGLRQALAPARDVFTAFDVAGATEQELRQRVADDYRAPFDLAAGPLIRVSLFSRAAGDHVLLFTVHHIAADAWSLWRMMEELRAGDDLSAPVYRYADKLADEAAFLQSPAAAAAWAYWNDELAGESPVLNLLTDKPRPAVQTLAGASVPFSLDLHESERLQALARQTGTTLYTLLLAAFQTLLFRYTNQDDILVGCPVAGRNQAASAPTVGYFVNPVVVRARIEPDETFDALLSDTRRRLLNAIAHQDLPFPLVAERFGGARDPGRSPIFQAAFVMQQLQQDAAGFAALMAPADPPVQLAWGGMQLEHYLLPQQEGQFDLTLEMVHAHGACHGLLKYNTDLWQASTIERMAAHFRTLLHSIADAPTKRVSRLPMVPDDERAALAAMSNGPRRDYDLQRPLHRWIEDQAHRTPEAIALELEGRTLTYAELNRRANGVARLLQAAGVGIGDPVPIAAERGAELVVGLLGALKSGGAYVPLDPDYPPARRDFMVADLSARVILDADRIRKAAAAGRDENLPYEGSPDALAYTIYTSGSTGMPKGAQNTHRGIVNRLCWMQEAFALAPGDRVLQKTPYSFDVSVWEFFWPLMVGARLVLARPDGHRDNHYLATLIQQAAITTLHFVPPMLHAFLDEPAAAACTSLRRVVCSGQELPASVRTRFFEVLPGATLHNLYGPTEAAVDVTWHACRPGDQRAFVPIGAPIANTSIYVLDRELAMTPIGVAGELYIGGVQVARGYLNRPELTAERFVANPFAAGERMYRSGDLARYLPEGDVEFLGRTDFQVKIRGLRVELGEIEHALTSHPDVREAIVLLREDRPGTRQLTAYLVSARADAAVLEQELRDRLAGALPAYMVPDALVLLPALPLTSNGKVDRKALPAPAVPVMQSRAAETDAERTLVAVWKDVLGLDKIGADDNFFSLGGDSIRSTQMIARARRHGYDFTVRDVLLHPTIAALARLAQPAPVSSVKAADAPATGEIPLLPMQHWFFGNGGAATARFNQAVALRPNTTLQIEPLRRALDDLVGRHEALRLRFPAEADGHRSAILVSAAEAAVHFGRWDRPFDVEAGPMMAAELVADGAVPRLVLTAHHLIVDGVSWRTLVGDLEIAYRARAAGRAPAFADEAPSYVAWARALVAFAATAAADAEAIHWLTEDWRRPEAWPLAAAPAEAPPAGAGELVFELAAEPLSGQEMEAVLLATLAGVLEPDVREPVLRVDLEGHGRAPLAGADGSAVVGWCAALFPALLRIEGESASSRGASVARTLAETPAGGRAFGLARYLSPRPRLRLTLASLPPASILFNYLGRIDGVLSPSSMFRVELPEGQSLRDDHRAPSYPLEVNATVQDGALRVALRFDRARVSESWLQAMAARWRSALADAATEAYPLTPMQKGILFHALLEPESGVYVQQLVATFDGTVDERWWRAAWDTVLDRHPVLRNSFMWKGLDQPLQQPVARVTMPWVTIDARGADRRAFEAALAAFLDEDRQHGFDLTMAPLHRVRLFLRDGGGTLVWTHHHILLDGRSMFQVLHEVLDTMRRYASGEPLPAATGLFRPFAAASSAAGDPSAIDYWRRQLQCFEAPTPIPFLDHGHEGDGHHLASVARTLSAAEADTVRRLARDAGVTLNLLTQSLLALLLSRWSGQDRVMFGTTVSAHPDGNAVGLYINTVPVVVPVPVTATVREWLADCQNRQAERSPFEQMGLVDVQRCSRMGAGQPMFDLLFVFENYGIDAALRQPAGGVSLRTVRVEEQTNLPLVLSVMPGETIELRLLHDSTRYPREAAELMVDSLAGLLRAAVQGGLDAPLKRLTPLDAATRRVVLEDWNATAADYPRDRRVNDLIRAQVARTPDAVAVRSGSVSLTYRALETRALQIAAALRRRGVGAGSIVGLCVQRGPDLLPALLGALEAGAAYVPLDLSFPAERLAFMLENSGAALVLTERGVPENLRERLGVTVPVMLLEDIPADIAGPVPSGPLPTANDLMYVLYTSGSTGQPKGVMVQHRSVVNFLCGLQVLPGLAPGDVVLGLTTLSFDIAVLELFFPLIVGASIVLVDDTDALDAHRVIRHLEGVTVIQATPSRYRLLLDAGWQGAPGLVAISGGEALPRDLSLAILQRCGRLWNFYAPTETTVYSIAIEVGRDEGPVPIGRPMANQRAYVLDAALEPVPIGAIGELFIGGDGVAVGYRGNPQLTAERFLPDPFAATPGARMYRTSDRARWRPDGTLEYLGRLDHQVKIRGYRVELGEIESVLATHPAVLRAAVIIREDRPGDQRLIAYYALRGGAVAEETALREHLQARLPAYMLPAHYVSLAAIPLTPNGKVDTKALPAPAFDRISPESAAPGSPVERELAAVFADVLGLAAVPSDESFFNLGGHSLLLLNVQSHIADRLGVEIEMVEFFRHPTIRDLGQLVERRKSGAAERGPLPVRSSRTAQADARQSQMDLRRAARETRKKDA